MGIRKKADKKQGETSLLFKRTGFRLCFLLFGLNKSFHHLGFRFDTGWGGTGVTRSLSCLAAFLLREPSPS